MVNFDVDGITFAFIGGVIISLSTTIHLFAKGRVTGMSGIFNGVITFTDFQWKSSFVAGLLLSSSIAYLSQGFRSFSSGQYFFDKPEVFAKNTSIPALILAAFLVGLGTKMGNGCTSGHGVCGIPRFSVRSLVAVPTFMASGILMANVKAHILPNFGTLDYDYDPESFAVGALILSMVILVINFVANQKGFAGTQDVFISFLVGMMFGFGLLLAGMSRKSKIVNFLTFDENWDVSLMFVMVGAILVNAFTFNFMIHKQKKPYCADELCLPKNKTIDSKLIFGSVLFGLGWGLGGMCPGPAMLITPVYYPYMLTYFLPALAAGSYLGTYLEKSAIRAENEKTKLA